MKHAWESCCSYLLIIFFSCSTSTVCSMGFNIALNNGLENAISVSKVPFSDITKIDTGKIVQHASGEVALPTIDIKESKSAVISDSKETISVDSGKITELFISLAGLDLSKINITESPFFIQRLAVKSGIHTVGHISFRCSIYNTNPVVTIESEDGYLISEKQMPIGGGGIHIEVKKRY